MSALNMQGHIDSNFKSATGTRTPHTVTRVNGVSQNSPGTPTGHDVTIQPLNPKEIQSLGVGAERVNDVRNIWVNDGDLYSISPSDTWQFLDVPDLAGTWKAIASDNRPWRNYCKLTVSRNDG